VPVPNAGGGVRILTEIPQKFLEGYKNGLYTINGVTVRNVQGRIVGHLEIVNPDILSRFLGSKISPFGMQTLMPQIAAVAFIAWLSSEILHRLGRIEAGVREIKDILNDKSVAELEAALRDLARAKRFSKDQRLQVVNQSRFSLAKLSNEFYSKVNRAHSPKETYQYLEFALAASLAQSYVYRLLGEEEMYVEELTSSVQRWVLTASSFLQQLLGNNPGRLFLKEYQKHISVKEALGIMRLLSGDESLMDSDLYERYRPESIGPFPQHLQRAAKALLKKSEKISDEYRIQTAIRLRANQLGLTNFVESISVLRKHVRLAELDNRLEHVRGQATQGAIFIGVADLDEVVQ